jgi:micrococcal nuclease
VTATTVFCADPARMQDARVLRVVDGDTIHVELNGNDETVRFYGIDTTEEGEPCFFEGKDRTAELVGASVRLLPDARERDRYGRLLRYVYTPEGLSVDAEMVAEGLARAWRADGALRFAIIELEDAAHAAHRGCLWR